MEREQLLGFVVFVCVVCIGVAWHTRHDRAMARAIRERLAFYAAGY